MDAEQREALVAEFRAYLERAATHPPGSEPPAEAPDLFTLLSELSALKSDVRHERRQFREVLEQLQGNQEQLRRHNERLETDLARERERSAVPSHGLLCELLDLRDRLEAGYRQAVAFQPGLVARLGGAKRAIRRLAQGMEINLRHLDEILTRNGVEAITSQAQPFDPQRMHAVDTTFEPAQPDGVVTQEIRRGFLCNGRLLRTAEVIVNKRDGRS